MSLKPRAKRARPQASRLGVAVGLTALLLAGSALRAQSTPSAPSLHHRPAPSQDEPAAPPVVATGHTDLPAQAEGEYPWKSWRGKGEIELYFEQGRLQGYMEEPQSEDNQTGAPLTFDFSSTHIEGRALSFTTRTLHGSWYSFDGHLERGLAQAPSQPGYYRLTGTLTEHSTGNSSVPHTVSLPREPDTE